MKKWISRCDDHIFNTLRVFTKEPIREQETKLECMNLIYYMESFEWFRLVCMWHACDIQTKLEGLSLLNCINDNTNIQRKIHCNFTYNFNNVHVKHTMWEFVFPELGRLNNNVAWSRILKELTWNLLFVICVN